MSNEPILDLGTIVERDTINLRSKKYPDGKLYELINLDELGPFEHAIIVKRHEKMGDLTRRTDRPATANEKRLLRKTIKDFLTIIVIGLEPQVLAEIDEIQGAKIMSAWARTNTPDSAEPAEGEPKGEA